MTHVRSTVYFQFFVLATLGLIVPRSAAPAEERANYFNDPFIQVTNAVAECPVPEGPSITKAEMWAQSHWGAERGTSCFLSGHCRLPNSYLYDKEVISRVKKTMEADGRFATTSLWVEGQRRWVWLKGCVRSQAEADALEQLVRNLDDVEAVVSQLSVMKPPARPPLHREFGRPPIQ